MYKYKYIFLWDSNIVKLARQEYSYDPALFVLMYITLLSHEYISDLVSTLESENFQQRFIPAHVTQ